MTERRLLAVVVVVIGALAIAAGVIYLTVAAKSLPSFMGPVHGFAGHRSRRGIAALVVGAILVLGGGWLIAHRPRRLA